MSKTKLQHLEDLAIVAFKMDARAALQDKRVEEVQRMASLARQGKKDTAEFKKLQEKHRHPKAIDFGNEMNELRRIVKRLRRYKITA